MVPCSSSTFSSNLTFGPNFRTSAAWMPSRSSSSRSERSSCLVVVSSRNAANISVDPAIGVLLLGAPRSAPCACSCPVIPSEARDLLLPLSYDGPVHHEIRFADLVQRQRDLAPVFQPERHVLVVRDREDLPHLSPAEPLGPHPRPLPDEAAPVLHPAQRTLEPRRRHLEDVAGTDQGPGFQESLEGPADSRAVVGRDSLAGAAVRAVHPYLQDGALQGSGSPEVGQFEAEAGQVIANGN